MCFVKWLQETRMLTIFDGWSSSIVISMLVKSRCSSLKGAVGMMDCSGALALVPPCWMHHSQLPITFCICMTMPGYKNWFCSRYSICSQPWCAASLWHPFIEVTQLAMGTMNSIFLPACHPVYDGDRGLLGRASVFSVLKKWPFLPQCSQCLPKDTSYPVLSDWESSWSWPWTLDLPTQKWPNQSHAACMAASMTCLCIYSSVSATTEWWTSTLFLSILWWLCPGWTLQWSEM